MAQDKLVKPAKHIFEEFIYRESSFNHFPVIPSNLKKIPDYCFNEDVISILNYVYFRMFQNRTKNGFNGQEIAKLSYLNIAKFSRLSRAIVKRLVPYIIEIGLLHLISGGGKTKKSGVYCPGPVLYQLYPQNDPHS